MQSLAELAAAYAAALQVLGQLTKDAFAFYIPHPLPT